MTNPVTSLKRISDHYKTLDAKDKRSFWIDGLLNNAIYIILVVFVIYTVIKNPRVATKDSIKIGRAHV